MCYVYCKELKGWCKSFTRTEGLLSILEAILFVVLIGFLVFLILHFVACRKLHDTSVDNIPDIYPTPNSTSTTESEDKSRSTTDVTDTSASVYSTLGPDVECTWEPSKPTSAVTRYYLSDKRQQTKSKPTIDDKSSTTTTGTHEYTTEELEVFDKPLEPSQDYDDVEFLEPSNGEGAEEIYKRQVIALVKLKTPGDATFGCILTKVTKYWTLTAASCIESIEEMDSLDSFVMVEQWGEGGAHESAGVADVRVHPRYQGRSRSHDLAALRSARPLHHAPTLRLPHIIDYFLVAIGERFLLLGYGGYRTVDKQATGRALRQVSVYVVAGEQCGAGEEEWAPRHLAGGAAQRHGACGGAAPLCAGARFARGVACNYCAGAPLTRAGLLFGVMSDNAACAVSCEPQLYVNIATHRDWIESVIE